MTQRAARRLVAAAALSVVALGALAACAGQPGAAAIVGQNRITTAQVDDATDGVITQCDADRASAAAAANSAVASQQLPPICGAGVDDLRSLDLQYRVTTAVASRYAAEKGITAPVVDPATVEQYRKGLGLDTAYPFLTDLVTAQAWVDKLKQAATPVTPTDAELMDIYNIGKAEGVTTDTYAQDKPIIAQIDGLGQALAVQRELTDAASRYGVSISPRFQPTATLGAAASGVQIPLLEVSGPGGNEVTVLSVDFGKSSSPAVANQPSQAPTSDNNPGGGTVGP